MKKILLIDDDNDFRNSLQDCLELEGYQIDTADDGQQGLKKFKQNPADLVITDIIMPQSNGIELICELRKKYPKATVKIIAMSGGGRIVGKEYLEFAGMLGADHIFEKPLALEQLLPCIKQLLGE